MQYEEILYEIEQKKRCSNLIKMIIVQGLIDVNAKTKNKIRKEGKISAKKWFRKNNEYFSAYCKLVGINKNYILKIYKALKSPKNKKICLIDALNSEDLLKIINKKKKRKKSS